MIGSVTDVAYAVTDVACNSTLVVRSHTGVRRSDPPGAGRQFSDSGPVLHGLRVSIRPMYGIRVAFAQGSRAFGHPGPTLLATMTVADEARGG